VSVMGGNITSGNIISANASTVDPCPGINLHAYIHTSCRGHLHLPLDSRLAPSLRETTPAQHIDYIQPTHTTRIGIHVLSFEQ
jgi:hypothetical protein